MCGWMDQETDNGVCLQKRRRWQYHAFISHHTTLRKDVEFVLSLRELLQENGYTILCPQEDFDDQLTLQENFEKAIDSCFRTIVVISYGYLNSKGCKKELDILYKRLHRRDKDQFLIPLFIDDLNELPDEGKHIQGISADNQNWFTVIKTLLSADDISDSKEPRFPQTKKKYNVFFSYKTVSPDKDWVKNVVRSLEASDPKIECAYHERDFEYGRSIVENIKHCVENSEKVVIVLTEEFLKSEWTKYETEIAQYRSIWNPNELVIIPVMLTPCDVPERLANITYLDATDDEQLWWNRLLKTVHCPNEDVKLRKLGKHEEIQTLKVSSFKGRLEEDDHESWLIDLVITSGHSLIVTDAKNMKVKMFTLKGVFQSEVRFPSRPMFLCVFDDSTAYITFPDETLVRTVKYNCDEKQLKCMEEIDVPKTCSGIARCGQDKFAICVRSECEIRIMTRHGGIVKTICPRAGVNEICFTSSTPHREVENTYDTDEDIDSKNTDTDKGRKNYAFYKKHRTSVDKSNRLILPGHMTSSKNGSSLYVTDYDRKHLIIIYLEENHYKHRSIPLNEPRGIAVHDERVYVAAGHVRLFDTSGNEHGEIPFHGGPVTFPRGTAIDSTNQYMAITHKGDGDDRISVYKLFPAF